MGDFLSCHSNRKVDQFFKTLSFLVYCQVLHRCRFVTTEHSCHSSESVPAGGLNVKAFVADAALLPSVWRSVPPRLGGSALRVLHAFLICRGFAGLRRACALRSPPLVQSSPRPSGLWREEMGRCPWLCRGAASTGLERRWLHLSRGSDAGCEVVAAGGRTPGARATVRATITERRSPPSIAMVAPHADGHNPS